MNREDFPLKTFDEVAYAVAGLSAYPANDFMCHRMWHPCEQARVRAGARIEHFLDELYRVGYTHEDIRNGWSRRLTERLFPANAYVYDGRPMDIAALDEERRFLNRLIHDLELIRDARSKALERDRKSRIAAQEELRKNHTGSCDDPSDA